MLLQTFSQHRTSLAPAGHWQIAPHENGQQMFQWALRPLLLTADERWQGTPHSYWQPSRTAAGQWWVGNDIFRPQLQTNPGHYHLRCPFDTLESYSAKTCNWAQTATTCSQQQQQQPWRLVAPPHSCDVSEGQRVSHTTTESKYPQKNVKLFWQELTTVVTLLY